MVTWAKDLNIYLIPGDCLFRAVKLTRNADPNKYWYSSYGVGFDAISDFAAVFGVGNTSYVHVKNSIKDILVLVEVPRDGLDNTVITVEAKYSLNITRSRNKISLSLHYNESNSFLYVNVINVYQFKSKGSDRRPYPLCLGNISKEFTVNNMKKIGLKGYLSDYDSMDYNSIDIGDTVDIHKIWINVWIY